MWDKIKEIITSTWLYVIAVVVLVIGIGGAIMFSPLSVRIWLAIGCGIPLIIILLNKALKRK